MGAFVNLDLLLVGIAIAGIGILGFVVYFNNRKSDTNKTFLLFSLSGILWGVFNYSYYQPGNPELILWLLRIHAFFAIWYVFFIFQIFYVFPRDQFKFSQIYKYGLIPVAVIIALLTLTPFVFNEITEFSLDGRIARVTNGFGIYLFGAFVFGMIFGGPFLLIKKRKSASDIERKQFKFVLIGALTTFSLHIIFNFILPAFFDNPRFIQFGGVFILPFVAFTSYAIFKHHLLDIKVIATEILAFLLAIVTFFEVVIAQEFTVLIFRSGVFILVLAFGIMLIKSVIREVKQREELERLSKQLAATNRQLTQLSQFKTQLLSLASHQVKSPLAAIKQFATLLLEGLYGPMTDKVKETVGKMQRASDRLLELVNTLLDLRKVEEGKMEYSFQMTKLNDIIKGVVEELEPLAKDKNLIFTCDLPFECYVQADALKLKQVIQNLVDNAIKYTPKGFVRITIKETPPDVVFSVSDSGVGIPAELIPHLFDEFVRDERVKKEILGTGLGLFIAKKIIEAHGGAIWVESQGVGKGSVFYVRLKKLT